MGLKVAYLYQRLTVLVWLVMSYGKYYVLPMMLH
jgi:hypothetical protein